MIKAFQKEQDIEVTGRPTEELLITLQTEVRRSKSSESIDIVWVLSLRSAASQTFLSKFEEDERSYEIAYNILRKLNVNSIKLITNNPHKIRELEKMGIKIFKRVSLSTKLNQYNKNYS